MVVCYVPFRYLRLEFTSSLTQKSRLSQNQENRVKFVSLSEFQWAKSMQVSELPINEKLHGKNKIPIP